MAFRFRRRLPIIKGLPYLNVGKRGSSISLGGRGATLNLSKRGTRASAGLTGSGLSWRGPTRPWAPGHAAGSAADTAPRRSTTGDYIFFFAVLAALLAIIVLAFIPQGGAGPAGARSQPTHHAEHTAAQQRRG